MFNNSKRIVSLILSLILILSFGTFSAFADENTKLASLTLSSGTLYPAFDPDVTSYTAVVDSLSSLPTITATLPEGSTDSVEIVTPNKNINYAGFVGIKAADASTYHTVYSITFTTGDKVIPVAEQEYIVGTTSITQAIHNVSGTMTTFYLDSAIDNNIATLWRPTQGDSTYTLTLENTAEISSIRLWTRAANVDDQVNFGDVDVSLDGTKYTDATVNAVEHGQQRVIFAASVAYVNSYEIEFTTPVAAKYIRLNIPRHDLRINEIQVIGSTDSNLNITTSSGTMYPAFSEDVTDYKVSVNSLSSLPTISATCSSLYEVTVTQASENNPTATVEVSYEGAVVKTYTFEVTDAGLPLAITGYTNTANVYAITTGSRKAASAYDGDYATRWTLNVVADHTYDLGKPYALTSLFIVCANSAKSDQNSYVPINCLGAYGSLEFSIDGTTWYKASGWQGEAKMSNKVETITTPDGQSVSVMRYINFEFDKETVARYFRFTGFAAWKFDVFEIVPVGKDAGAVSLTNPNADGTGAQVYTTAAANGTAFCAYYDAEDNLLDIAQTPFTASGAGAYTLTFSAAPTGTVSSRIYLWNGTTLVPLAINKTTAPAVPNIE